jgi:class 3 adenylate cyclase
VLVEAEMDFTVNDNALEEALAKVEGVRIWSPRVISKLENSIRTADDRDLFRINPLQWAQEKNVEVHEAIDLFLHGAKAGLFYMDWNVICPCCGKIIQSLRELHSLRTQINCSVCFRNDQATLDDYVQVTFTLSPSIRSLRFHHPETLSLEDYCFKYLFERGVRFGESATMTLDDFVGSFSRHFSTFSPGEKITVTTEVGHGTLFCNDLFSQKGFVFLVDEEPTNELQTVAIKLTEQAFEVSLPQIQPGEIHFAHKFMTGTFYPLHPGKVVLELEQASASQAALFIWSVLHEQILAFPDAGFVPSLTAKKLFACQTFHDLFKAEVFRESEGFGVKDVTILFTDLKSSTQLYQQIGDLNAYALVREHYGVLNKAILHQHGAVVKTIGDAIMATFTQPVEALGAGLEMLNELRKLNQASRRGDLILKIGIHRGAAISVNLNDSIDYFGQTVNIAARVQGSAGGEEIFLTEEIYCSAGVKELLQDRHCQTEAVQVQLRGIEEQVKIYKVTSAG